MIITVFRSRLDANRADAYAAMAQIMKAQVENMPGLIGYKMFEAKDGERVTIAEFADEASHNAWHDHPVYRKAMELGKAKFYEEYKVQVCSLIREFVHRR